MSHALYTNMPRPAELARDVAVGDTIIYLSSGDGALFPTITETNYFYATLFHISQNVAGLTEIVKCTARSGDVLTVIRGQQGTSADSYNHGEHIEIRVTAAGLEEFNTTDLTDTSLAVDVKVAAALAVAGTAAVTEGHNAPSKNPVVAADEFIIYDSVTAFLNKLTYANLLSTIATALAAMTNTWAISISGNAATADNATTATSATSATTAANGVPAGMVMDFPGTIPPSGWEALPFTPTDRSRTTYAAVFANIGTTCGVGDGSTTFGWPYCPENYAVVAGTSVEVGTVTTGANKSHNHPAVSLVGYNGTNGLQGGVNLSFTTGTTGSSGGTDNLAAGVKFLKCIKL